MKTISGNEAEDMPSLCGAELSLAGVSNQCPWSKDHRVTFCKNLKKKKKKRAFTLTLRGKGIPYLDLAK